MDKLRNLKRPVAVIAASIGLTVGSYVNAENCSNNTLK